MPAAVSTPAMPMEEAKVTGEAKLAVAATVRVCVLLVPRAVFPCAVRAPETVSALTVTRALAVTGPMKVVVAYTVRRVVLPLMPMTVAPCAVRLPVNRAVPLAVTAAAKVLGRYTASVEVLEVLLLLLLPRTVLPEAVRVPVTVRLLPAVTAASKDATAFTVRVWLPLLLPKTVLPFTLTGPENGSSNHSTIHACVLVAKFVHNSSAWVC